MLTLKLRTCDLGTRDVSRLTKQTDLRTGWPAFSNSLKSTLSAELWGAAHKNMS